MGVLRLKRLNLPGKTSHRLTRDPRFLLGLIAHPLRSAHALSATPHLLLNFLSILSKGALSGNQALAKLRKLYSLALTLGLLFSQLRFKRVTLALHLLKTDLQFIYSQPGVSKLPLSLGALLTGGTDDLGNPALGGPNRRVVKLGCEHGDPLGQRLGHGCKGLRDFNRQIRDMLELDSLLASEVLFPHLMQTCRIAATDPLAEGETRDVATDGPDGLAGGDDLFSGVFGWTHGAISSTDTLLYNKQRNKQTNN